MDVLVLVDRLDDLLHNAKAIPLTDQVRIDREAVYDILDQIRATLPTEIEAARAIVASGSERPSRHRRSPRRRPATRTVSSAGSSRRS